MWECLYFLSFLKHDVPRYKIHGWISSFQVLEKPCAISSIFCCLRWAIYCHLNHFPPTENVSLISSFFQDYLFISDMDFFGLILFKSIFLCVTKFGDIIFLSLNILSASLSLLLNVPKCPDPDMNSQLLCRLRQGDLRGSFKAVSTN